MHIDYDTINTVVRRVTLLFYVYTYFACSSNVGYLNNRRTLFDFEFDKFSRPIRNYLSEYLRSMKPRVLYIN